MYVICLPCPSVTFALQHGSFLPREWLAAKGLLHVSEILAPFCSDDSIQILVNLTFRPMSNLEGFVWGHQSITGLISQRQ